MALSVILVGVGLVGKEVLKQLSLPALSKLFRVDGLTNSKFQVLVPASGERVELSELLQGLPPSSIAGIGETSPSPSSHFTTSSSSFDDFVNVLVRRNASVSQVVVDCTSENSVAAQYPVLLKHGVHIVTPNKKAFSGAQSLYDDIQNAVHPSLLLQEATVGAGLPIISTLQDLLLTGDRILKVEGVLSGTMSYIFNNFSKADGSEAPKFSQVVQVAKDNGYTEPHPGDDLNGSDVARKLCILSRIIGSPLPPLPRGFESVETQSLIPESLAGIASGAVFLRELPHFDSDFAALQKRAQGEGKVLRYVALLDVASGKAKAGLESYPVSHPFAAALSGSDNIIAFTTERYPNPLIIQGAGAGAAVTAMGVVADLIKVAQRGSQQR